MIQKYEKFLLFMLCFVIFVESIIALILKTIEAYVAIPCAILSFVGMVIVLLIPTKRKKRK